MSLLKQLLLRIPYREQITPANTKLIPFLHTVGSGVITQ